jgi:hypothetical protein
MKRPTFDFFKDVRDKYRIFYLTGHQDLFNSTDIDRDYNPVEAARAAGECLPILLIISLNLTDSWIRKWYIDNGEGY